MTIFLYRVIYLNIHFKKIIQAIKKYQYNEQINYITDILNLY